MNRHKIRNVAPLLLPAFLLAFLLTATPSGAQETRTLTNIRGEQVTVPHVVPAREDLALLKMVVVKMETSNGQGGLVFAIYGTDESMRLEEATYVERYDLAGNLLEIAWFDDSGQVKVAHDKNLTDPDAKGPAKVLVMDADDRPSVDEQSARLHL